MTTQEITELPIESPEQRAQRKLAAINDMCSKLDDLYPDMLGQDSHANPLTYNHLTDFLRRALGVHPSFSDPDFALVQEELWVILIDKRDKCHKDPKDLYYPQTFLSLVGYMCQNGLIVAKPAKLMKVLYPSADAGLVQNLKRPIPVTFPQGTQQMLDALLATI